MLSRAIYALLFEDWILKFICVALAIMMWFYIDGELTGQVDVTVQMRPGDLVLPAELALAPDQQLPKLRVIVRGPRNRLQLMSADRVSLKKKIPDNPHAGHNPLSFLPTDAEAEGNFEILSVSPHDGTEAAVDLIELVTRAKPVIVKCRGEPRAGFLLGKGTSDPDKVNIDGPAQDVDAIQSVNTEEIDVTDLDKNVIREVAIANTVDVNGRTYNVHCLQRVHVTVPITLPEAHRVVVFDVKTIAPPGLSMQVEPKQLEVDLVGNETDVASPDVLSKIVLYVKWPDTLDRPTDPGVITDPHSAQIQVFAPPHISVRSKDDGPLPTVSVRGALAPAIKPKE